MSSSNTEIAKGLTAVLADTFVIYFKTHSFHWNVEGPHFKPLHEMFEEQYTALWKATDELAERIRTIGSYAPDNFKTILEKASLRESGQTPDADAMVEMLANDNTEIVKNIYNVLRTAEEAGDEATVDMLIQRIEAHEKAAWMLRSTAKKSA